MCYAMPNFDIYVSHTNFFIKIICDRSGDVRKAVKGDSSWVRETANHAGELNVFQETLFKTKLKGI